MDEVEKERDQTENTLKATGDKKWKWNSFRKGRKHIKNFLKSKKSHSKLTEDQNSPPDSGDDAVDDSTSERLPMSPISTTSSFDVPSIMLQRPSLASSPEYMPDDVTTDEDEHFSSSKENHNSVESKGSPHSLSSRKAANKQGSDSSLNGPERLPKSPSVVSLSKLWMVHVELMSGHNLAIRDRSGSSDPYVKMRLGNQRQKTRIIYRNLNPVWNESFSFTTSNLSELLVLKVYDHDWGSLDDFMGRATISLATMTSTQEEQVIKLDLQDDTSQEELGYLTVKLRMESGMTTSQKVFKSQKHALLKRRCSTANKCQMWDSVLIVTLLRGKSLPPMDDNGFSDPYCKFKLGTQKYRSRVIHKTLDPEWKERFELRMYEGQSSILTIEAWDRDIAAKDDYMGKCQVDLASLEVDVNNDLVLDLDVGVGQVHLQLCITGTASQQTSSANGHLLESQESQQPQEETNWDQIVKKYSLAKTLKNLKDIGFLQVTLNCAEGLISSGHCNPFAILEVGNTRVRTHTLYRTHSPAWDKIFNFQIKDVHDNLEIFIFSGDKHTDLLGRVCIPLLKIVNGKKKAYALKNKHCLQRSHGSVFMTCRFAYNNVRAAVRTISPREAKVLDEEPKLNRKRLIKNIRRVSSQIETAYSAIQFVNGLFQWTNYVHSSLAFVVFVLLSLYGEWWMPFMMLVLVFVYQYIAVGMLTHQTKGLLEHSTEESTDSESEFSGLDDEDLTSPNKPNEEKKGIVKKLKQFQNVLIIVQNTLDQIASTVERVYNLFNWSVPFCSMMAVTILCVAATLFYFIPPNYLVLAWGVNKFSKRLLRPNHIPNNELMDFISCLPSDEELLMRKELRPHLLSRKKRSSKNMVKHHNNS